MARTEVFLGVTVLGRLIKGIATAVRADVGHHGEIHYYWDGTYVRKQVYDRDLNGWQSFDPTALLSTLYAPIGAGYLVTVADSDLTGEVAVGATPGGELGGSWASPTVDATHSGSAHHTKYTDGEVDTIVATHAAIATSHHSNANDHVKYTAAEAVTDTAAAIDTDIATHAALPHGGMSLIHSSDSETSFTDTTEADVLTIGSLSIPANHGIRIELGWRMTNANASSFNIGLGLKLNTTVVDDAQTVGSITTSQSPVKGSGIWEIFPRDSDYNYGGFHRFIGRKDDGGSQGYGFTVGQAMINGSGGDAAHPTATITSIAIRGIVTNATDQVGYIKYIRIWELPN